MANSWFRLYAEFAHDAKVQMMGECEQRRLIMLFCIRCNGDVTLQDEEVAFQLRISNEEWVITKALFLSKGFINETNEVLNWDKRQYVSDSSAERVARHRNKKKQECNVTVTPPDTEQIQIQNTDKNKYIPPIGAELLSDWMEVRKAKRAGKLTKTAFAGIEREASKAGISAEQAIKICCERGWAGFKADWMTSAKQPAKSSGNQSAVDRRIDIANQMFGSITGGNNGRVIEHG